MANLLASFLLQMFSNNDEAVINKKLPKELLLRIFSFLDVVTLCRCAQVSRVRTSSCCRAIPAPTQGFVMGSFAR